MRTPKTFFALLFTSLLLVLSSCDWLNDEDSESAAFTVSSPGIISDPILSNASEFFNELDVSGTYDGTLTDGVTEDAVGDDKSSLDIGVNGSSVIVADDLGIGNGYTGVIGFIAYELGENTDPVESGTVLATWQINFSGVDNSTGLTVEFAGTISLVSTGVKNVADGGTISTILRLQGTWVEVGGNTTDAAATRVGPDLNLTEPPFNVD